jgi:CPA2 family monovalent cation:H+ antiporter-2
LFFMTVGMRLDLGLLAGAPLRVALMLAATMAAKLAVMVALGLAFRLSLAVALPAALVLAQGGEFAFVLFDQAARSAILRPEQAEILRLAVTASMMATPGLAALAARTAHRLRPAPAEGARLDAAAAVDDHVIVAGFGRVGRTVARLLEHRRIPYVALDMNPERVAAARARSQPVFYADAGRPEVLRAAGAARARALVLTLDRPGVAEAAVQTCRLNFPDLPIYARARDARRSDKLRQVGATLAVPETVEASLQLGAAVLRGGGVTDDDLRALLAELRRDDYAGLGE